VKVNPHNYVTGEQKQTVETLVEDSTPKMMRIFRVATP